MLFASDKSARVIHIVRYDDFSAASHRGVEEALFDIFLRLRIPCTVAVIPFICDPESLLDFGAVRLSPFPQEKARLLDGLLREGLAEVALHGYTHLALAPMREYQEFSDAMPVATQRVLIRRGRQYLEDIFGVKVRLFVPPWNRLGANTTAVLREEGLMMSGDLSADGIQDFELAQVPCATLIHETGRALLAAQRFGGRNSMVGTMIHDYDFVESGYRVGSLRIAEFERIAGAWSRMPNARRMLITDAILSHDEPAAERLRSNTKLRQRLQSSKLGRLLLPSAGMVYWDTTRARRLARLTGFLPEIFGCLGLIS
jgi:peptidoglycan/xylan/chitin deacetylase (PgdA/CDA1 family)